MPSVCAGLARLALADRPAVPFLPAQLYPTIVRALALAMCNGFSRLGGFLAPFATVYLVADGRTHAAELLLGSLCCLAGLCALLLPYETRGRDLQALELQPDGSWPRQERRGAQQRSSNDGGGGGGEVQAAGSGDSSRSLRGVRVQPHSDDDGELELEPTHEAEQGQGQVEERPLLPAQPRVS